MELKRIFFYYFIIAFLSSEVASESLYKDLDKSLKYISVSKSYKDHKEYKTNLFSDFNKLISSGLIEEKIKEETILNTESDTFFIEDNKNIYEGNIILTYKNTTLNSDYLEIDTKNKLIVIKDNVIFRKNEEYFKADSITYDQKNKRGKIINVYGTINFGRINSNYFSNDKIYPNKSKNITLQSENSLSIDRDIESDQNFGISKF